MSRTRREIVDQARTHLQVMATLSELCDELGKVDDLDQAVAKAQERYDEVQAAIKRLDTINASIAAKTAELASIEKRIEHARAHATAILISKAAVA